MSHVRCLLAAVAVLTSISTSSGQVLFHEDFKGLKLNTTHWAVLTGPGSYFGRTQINPGLPQLSGGHLHLYLDTYNPTALKPGDSFWGRDIYTKKLYSVPTKGISFETRMKLGAGTPPGLVGAFFTYGLNGGVRDELDFELISNDLALPTQRVLTNSFKAMNFSQPGQKAFVSLAPSKMQKFNVYRIDWYPTKVEWYVNNVLKRRETIVVPTRPQSVHLNLWAPDQYFPEAYSPSLVPARTAATNKRYLLVVDYVTVRALP